MAPRKAWKSRIVGDGEVDPTTLVPNPENWRTHGTRQTRAMGDALDTVGWVQRVIVNRRTGRLVDGHLRVALAIERGMPTVPVEYVDLSEQDERLVLATLDPIGAMADTNKAALAAIQEQFADASEQVRALLEAAGVKSGQRITQPDADDPDPPGAPRKTTIKVGDLYALGEHRALCGDSTSEEDVSRLMGDVRADCVLTDPPYAIYGSSSGLSSSVTDDKIVRPFFRDVIHAAQRITREFAHVYVFCDWRSWPSWWEVAKGTNIVPKNCVVWDKNGAGLGNYPLTHRNRMRGGGR